MSKKKNCGSAILFKSYKCLLRKAVRSCLHRPCFYENTVWLPFIGGIVGTPLFNYQGDGGCETSPKPCLQQSMLAHDDVTHSPHVYSSSSPQHRAHYCTSYMNRETTHGSCSFCSPWTKPESRWNFIYNFTHSLLFCFQEIYVPLWGILIEVQGSSAEMTTHAGCRISLKVFISASWDHTKRPSWDPKCPEHRVFEDRDLIQSSWSVVSVGDSHHCKLFETCSFNRS